MFSFILFFCYRGPPWKPLNVMGVSSLKINYYYYYYKCNLLYHGFPTKLDCEQSLFCSKNPAGGAARKRVRYLSREPRAASSVGGRASERRAKRETAMLLYCISEARHSGDGMFWLIGLWPDGTYLSSSLGDIQCAPTATVNRIADRNRSRGGNISSS